MIETIAWHNAKEERPTKSGHYLVACNHSGQPYITKTVYSKKHDKFNCADKDDARYAFDVDYWADARPLEVLV